MVNLPYPAFLNGLESPIVLLLLIAGPRIVTKIIRGYKSIRPSEPPTSSSSTLENPHNAHPQADPKEISQTRHRILLLAFILFLFYAYLTDLLHTAPPYNVFTRNGFRIDRRSLDVVAELKAHGQSQGQSGFEDAYTAVLIQKLAGSPFGPDTAHQSSPNVRVSPINKRNRLLYARFGHDVFACSWCSEPLDYTLVSLPRVVGYWMVSGAVLRGMLAFGGIARAKWGAGGAPGRRRGLGRIIDWVVLILGTVELALRSQEMDNVFARWGLRLSGEGNGTGSDVFQVSQSQEIDISPTSLALFRFSVLMPHDYKNSNLVFFFLWTTRAYSPSYFQRTHNTIKIHQIDHYIHVARHTITLTFFLLLTTILYFSPPSPSSSPSTYTLSRNPVDQAAELYFTLNSALGSQIYLRALSRGIGRNSVLAALRRKEEEDRLLSSEEKRLDMRYRKMTEHLGWIQDDEAVELFEGVGDGMGGRGRGQGRGNLVKGGIREKARAFANGGWERLEKVYALSTMTPEQAEERLRQGSEK